MEAMDLDMDKLALVVAEAVSTHLLTGIKSVITECHTTLEQRLGELVKQTRCSTPHLSREESRRPARVSSAVTSSQSGRSAGACTLEIRNPSLVPLQRRQHRAQTSTATMTCLRALQKERRRQSVSSLPENLTLAFPRLLDSIEGPPSYTGSFNCSVESAPISSPVGRKGSVKTSTPHGPLTRDNSDEPRDTNALQAKWAMHVLKSVDLVPRERSRKPPSDTCTSTSTFSSVRNPEHKRRSSPQRKSQVSESNSRKNTSQVGPLPSTRKAADDQSKHFQRCVSCDAPPQRCRSDATDASFYAIVSSSKIFSQLPSMTSSAHVHPYPSTGTSSSSSGLQGSSKYNKDAERKESFSSCTDTSLSHQESRGQGQFEELQEGDLSNELSGCSVIGNPASAPDLCDTATGLEPHESTSFKVVAVEDLRRKHASDLTAAIASDGLERSASCSTFIEPLADEKLKQALGVAPPLLLRLCGIFPWGSSQNTQSMWCLSMCYKWLVALLCIFALGACVNRAMCTSDEGMYNQCEASQKQLLSDLPLAFGSIAGLVSLGVLRCSSAGEALTDCRKLLVRYALHAQLLDEWRAWSRWDLVGTLVVWIFAVVERARASDIFAMIASESTNVLQLLHVVYFAIFSGVLMGLTFCLLYFCRLLCLIVDSFCNRMIDAPVVLQAVHEWNVIRAILRQASNVVERCFFVMQAVSVTTFEGIQAAAFLVTLLSIIDTVQVDGRDSINPTALIPGALIALGISRVFFCAAAVSDKCSHVPSWVNSLTFGTGVNMDLERHYVVEYIFHSDAGFYIFEVRLSSVLALKVTYLICVVAFALATQLLRLEAKAG